jgi:hypothetical protein
VLGHITGKTAIFALRTAYVALFTAAGADDGTGFTEVAGGAYSRVATAPTDWSAPSSQAPSLIQNANPIVFPVSTAGWGTVLAFGIYDAATAGNLMAWDYFGAFAWLPCTVSAAAPAVITSPRHNFLNGDTVMFSLEYGGVAPTYNQGGLTGALLVANSLTDTFTTTQGGLAVNSITSGDGSVRKVATQSIIANVQATFPANSLSITLA